MCYYNSLMLSKQQSIFIKDQQFSIDFNVPVGNGFNYGDWLIFKQKEDLELVKAHWEFIPYWHKTTADVMQARKKFTTLNATAEKLLESRMYKESALKRRCLVLSNGFYEWRHVGKLTYPYFISIKNPEEPCFFMAGIYTPWVNKETGEMMDSFAIITTEANDLMQKIHNTKKRMPVILPKELAEEWLNPELPEERIKALASYKIESEKLQAHTIKKTFRADENPEEFFEYPELQLLDS